MSFSFLDTLQKIWNDSGFTTMTWQQLVMICVACVLVYLAIAKKFEPLLLLPIAFGVLLANLPMTGLMAAPPDGSSEPGGLLYYLYMGVKKGIYPSLIFLGQNYNSLALLCHLLDYYSSTIVDEYRVWHASWGILV